MIVCTPHWNNKPHLRCTHSSTTFRAVNVVWSMTPISFRNLQEYHTKFDDSIFHARSELCNRYNARGDCAPSEVSIACQEWPSLCGKWNVRDLLRDSHRIALVWICEEDQQSFPQPVALSHPALLAAVTWSLPWRTWRQRTHRCAAERASAG